MCAAALEDKERVLGLSEASVHFSSRTVIESLIRMSDADCSDAFFIPDEWESVDKCPCLTVLSGATLSARFRMLQMCNGDPFAGPPCMKGSNASPRI